MDDDIRQLVTKANIVDTLNRLFVSTDERDWEAVAGCFADSVLLDMTSLTGGEPAHLTPLQIADAWREGLRPIDAVHHQVANYRVDLQEDGAVVFCNGTATHYRKTKSGRNLRTFVGSYDFHLVQRGAEWRVDEFRFNVKYLDGNLTLEQDEPAEA